MGLFDRLFGNRPDKKASGEASQYFKTLTAYAPVFTSWKGSIYESQLVRASIDAIARNIAKLDIQIQCKSRPRLQSLMRTAPNEMQTWSQFLYKTATILEAKNNCFICPIYDEYGQTSGIYAISPSIWSLVQNNNSVYIRFQFESGESAAFPIGDVGILTKHQFKNDYFGEDNSALTPVMELINIQNQSIREGAKNSATYRFMAKLTNFTSPEDLKKEQQRFNKAAFASDGGGLLLFPNGYGDIKQITSQPFVLDTAQMENINKNVYNYFGVNEKIIQNSASDEEMDSFFNGKIEPFSIQLAEVLNKMLFTWKQRNEGNVIYVASNRLQYMSVSHKIQIAEKLGDRGMITIDEIRALFNYPPLPDGKGTFTPIRGEYYNINSQEVKND